MASRLELEGGNLPITPQLVFGLAVGFAIFNQVLSFLLSVALTHEGRFGPAGLFAVISSVLGVGILVSTFLWQARHRLLQRTDAIVFVIAGVLVAMSLFFLSVTSQIRAGEMGLASSVVLGGWQARGLIRKWIAARFRSCRK